MPPWIIMSQYLPEKRSIYKSDYKVKTPYVDALNELILKKRREDTPKDKLKIEAVPISTYTNDFEGIFRPADHYTKLPLYQDKEKRRLCDIDTGLFRPGLKRGNPPPSNLLIYQYTAKDRKKIMNPEPPPVHPVWKDDVRRKQKWPIKNKILEAKFGHLDMLQVDKLEHKLRWTSTTHAEQEDNFIPIEEIDPKRKTFDKKADPVAFSVNRYYPEPQEWQKLEQWDRYQLREPVPTVPPPVEIYDGQPLMRKRLGIRTDNIARDEKEHMDRIYPLVRKKLLVNDYVRKIPGYAGYVPMMATEENMEKSTIPNPCEMKTTMTASYREYPASENLNYNSNKRNTPFSNTISLNNPYNPFKHYNYRETEPWRPQEQKLPHISSSIST